MKLYLIRHGAYLSSYTTSAGPGLSPFGFEQARAVGAFLKAQGAAPEVVITTPYLRAQETAATIQDVLGTTLEPVILRDFTPDGDPRTMRAIIEALPVLEVIVVGHMCAIGELAQLLHSAAPSVFDTCTAVAFEKKEERWQLLWVEHCGRIEA